MGRDQLAGRRVFRCSECGRIKRVKYVPTSKLCRQCAAEGRAKELKTLVTLADDVVVTKAVEMRLARLADAFRKQLQRQAETDVPRTRGERLGEAARWWIFPVFWVPALFAGLEAFQEDNGTMWWLFWCLCVAPLWIYLVIESALDKYSPRTKRHRRFVQLETAKVVQLAKERKDRIDERNQFYSSAEWKAVRREVIKEDGRLCAECGRRIHHDIDVTVDHIEPRSKFPKLALSRENLRVLCRGCNARKGDRSS